MLIPDVLALPLAEAIARLEAAEIGYTVAATQRRAGKTKLWRRR